MAAKEKTTRRAFLQGKALPGKAAVDPGRDATDRPKIDATSDPYLVRIGRRAMACQFQIFVNAGQFDQAMDRAVEALDHVEALEQILTIYRDDSEISWVNQMAHDEPVAVGADAFAVLEQAIALHETTDGAFDVTSGFLCELWRRARRDGRLPSESELTMAAGQAGSQGLQLDSVQQTIRFLKRGIQVNLGGIGKGYALDEASEILTNSGVTDFLFHGGKSSVLARGSRAGGCAGGGWSVGLIHPLRPDQRLAEIHVRNRALSTSGSQTQSFHFEGRRLGHILDPRSGRPAEGVLSATVLARTAAEADALSTALFVMGPERTVAFCHTHPEISVILVVPGTKPSSIEIITHNLSGSDWTLLDSEMGAGSGRTVCADSSPV